MENRRIIIEGDQIRYEEVVASAGPVPLAALAPFLSTRLATTWPILPDNTCYTSLDPEERRGVIAIQQKPRRTNLNIMGRRYNLQLPFQYFIFSFTLAVRPAGDTETMFDFVIDRSNLYWRPATYATPEDTFWPAQLPNVRHGDICWGTTQADRTTFASNINALVNSFDITNFNNELGLATPDYGSDYGEWAVASEDPTVYLRWGFWERMRPQARTMAELYEQFLGRTAPPAIDESNSLVAVPEIPVNFTYGRARELLQSLSAPQRRRIIAAATSIPAPRGRDIADPPDNPDPNGRLDEVIVGEDG